MADVLRQMLDNGELNDETCRSILMGLGKDVDQLQISSPKKEVADWSWSSSDEEEDPNYSRQLRESQGFGNFYNNSKTKKKFKPSCAESLYGRLGVHCFNFHKGRSLKFMGISYSIIQIITCMVNYYITVDVEDLADNSPHTFQTKVRECMPRKNAAFNVCTDVCRLKPDTPEPFPRDDKNTVDKFYNCSMPKFVAHLPRAIRLRFYEVQEQDIVENDWLRLYTNFAFYSLCGIIREKEYESSLPLQINKIVVETFETHSEPCLKLKSSNAIFYINFTAHFLRYISVVRRTTDAESGNMTLEINCQPIKIKKNKCVF